jgi:hypothetical protein
MYSDYLQKESQETGQSKHVDPNLQLRDNQNAWQDLWKCRAQYLCGYFQRVSQEPVETLTVTPDKNYRLDLSLIQSFIPSQWTPEAHCKFPYDFRCKIVTLLLIWHRSDSLLSVVPKECLHRIISHLADLEFNLVEKRMRKRKKVQKKTTKQIVRSPLAQVTNTSNLLKVTSSKKRKMVSPLARSSTKNRLLSPLSSSSPNVVRAPSPFIQVNQNPKMKTYRSMKRKK